MGGGGVDFLSCMMRGEGCVWYNGMGRVRVFGEGIGGENDGKVWGWGEGGGVGEEKDKFGVGCYGEVLGGGWGIWGGGEGLSLGRCGG